MNHLKRGIERSVAFMHSVSLISQHHQGYRTPHLPCLIDNRESSEYQIINTLHSSASS